MNPPDQLRYLLAVAVADRLRKSPYDADVAIARVLSNIKLLDEKRKATAGDAEWFKILTSRSAEEIANLLISQTDDSQRLRSNLRGNGVITDEERLQIIRIANGLQPATPSFLQP